MPQCVDGRAQQLEDAFQLFTQMSSQLEASYRTLETRVSELSAELVAARSERLEQLAEKERIADRLQRLLELLPGGVVVIDGEDQVSDCNPAAVTLLGQPLLGERWQTVVERAFAAQAGNGEWLSCNGRTVSVSRRALGQEPGHIILLLDVTEQQALQEMVHRNKRLSAMGEMAASLAHQVRTPLASALLYASQLSAPSLNGAARARFSERVVGRLRHLEAMVNEMLQFARGGSFELSAVPVQALLDDLAHTLDPQLRAGGGSLELLNRLPGAALHANQQALHSALLNLATNALQARPKGLRLQVQVRALEGGRIELLLRDNGPGIPEDVRERVFTPFFTTRSDGTGLGLPVVRAIVLAHGGELWMRSEAGQGTTFGLVFQGGTEHALPSGQEDSSATELADRDLPQFKTA